jgi:hypothetical protein
LIDDEAAGSNILGLAIRIKSVEFYICSKGCCLTRFLSSGDRAS